MENQQKYLVAIKCITYNHEKYLADALEGFVMQKTNFPFVAIVHDDASMDGTAAILRQYAEKYPDIIHPIYETENQYSKRDGSLGRIMNEAVAATGAKYIAMCEGDDYWTDPNKLQKQVDFLEGHEDYSICFHSVNVLNQTLEKIVDDFITRDVPGRSTIEDLSKGNYIHTPSVMYRYDSSITDIISQMGNLGVGDYISHMLHACNGKIMKLPDVMAIYRYGVGVWSSAKQRNESKEMQWMVAISKLLPLVENPIAKRNLDEQISLCIKSISDEFVYLEGIRNSHAYRLGKAILRPFSWIKRKWLSFFRK